MQRPTRDNGAASADRTGLGADPAEAVAVAETPRPAWGARVGRYRLCFELWSGGMAHVFLARVEGPAKFQKPVAVKRIHPHLAQEQGFVEMFLDEAALAARIDHPNVCSVFDFGCEDDSYFLVMEYLVGEPLSQIRRASRKQQGLDPHRHAMMVARVIADACEGLHSAHELRNTKGEPLHVVHRDISPDNIIVTYDGVPKIVDFGVASARERIHKTTTGLVKGKHAYMAPEQLGEDPVDRRVDVWAMGVVLWESLCRRRLFRRASHSATLMAVMRDRIPWPSEVDPGLPRMLDAVVMKALSRDPEERHASARELSQDLRRQLNGLDEPVGAPEVAQWLDELFPGSQARQRELVELALSLPDGELPMPGRRSASRDTGSEPEVRSAATVRAPRLRRRARWPWAVGAAVALAIAAAAGSMLGTEQQADSTDGAARASKPAQPPAAAAAGSSTEPEAEAGSDDAAPDEDAADSADPGAASDDEPSAAAGGDPRASHDSPAEPRGRASRATRRGTVNVLLPPGVGWAHVYHRGRRLPDTAPGLFRLPAGRQALHVRPMGEEPATRVMVRVRPGQSTTVRVPR